MKEIEISIHNEIYCASIHPLKLAILARFEELRTSEKLAEEISRKYEATIKDSKFTPQDWLDKYKYDLDSVIIEIICDKIVDYVIYYNKETKEVPDFLEMITALLVPVFNAEDPSHKIRLETKKSSSKN